jgi:methionyl-tRNA synthetase
MDFTWREYVRRNNDELVATWGNLVNRVLSLTHRNFDGRVPDPGELTDRDRQLVASGERALAEVGAEIGGCRFRSGVSRAMAMAQEANRYLDETAPWKTIREDRPAAARSLYTALAAIDSLNVAFAPFLPFSSERLYSLLHGEGSINASGWRSELPRPGQILGEPKPLFVKLDPSVAEEEERRLGA